MIDVNEIYDDSNCFIDKVFSTGDKVIVDISYDNSKGSKVHLRVEMDGILFNNVRVGECTFISVYDASTIIDQFNGDRCDVYLCSKCSDPISFFNDYNAAIKEYYGDYEIVDEVLYGGINTLVRGSGLLARCSLGYGKFLKRKFENIDLLVLTTKAGTHASLLMIDFGGEYIVCNSYSIVNQLNEEEVLCIPTKHAV